MKKGRLEVWNGEMRGVREAGAAPSMKRLRYGWHDYFVIDIKQLWQTIQIRRKQMVNA
jgi:hypothetical protein